MSQSVKHTETEKELLVRRGRVDSVDLYEVKDNELELLANGDTSGIYLNFAIFLISTSFSSILAICTASFNRPIFLTTFLIIAIVGGLGGALLILLWWKGRKSISELVKKIKARITPEQIIKESVAETTVVVDTSDGNIKPKE